MPADRTPLDLAPEPAAGLAPTRVGAGFLTLFGFLNFGLYLTVMMPALFSLPHKISLLDPESRVIGLGIVATIAAVVSLVTGPAAGVLSDRTSGRWGRRRPWLVGGVLIGLLGSMIVALAPNLPLVTLGWVVVAFGGAGCGAAITPIVAERVPEEQRGLVGAIVGVATQLAGVLGYTIGSFLTFDLVVLFTVPWALLGLIALVWILVIPERQIEIPRTTLRQTFALLVFNPRKYPDFGWVWLGKLLMQIALAFLSTYQLYFLADRLGFSSEEAGQRLALVGGIGILVTMSFAVLSGMLSDRLKRRRIFILISAIMTAVGMGLMAITDGFGLFFAAVICILGAAGMFGAVDVAMASDLVPDRDQAGRWMAIYNLAATLSTAIAPLAGALLLTLGDAGQENYTLLFLVGAVIALCVGAVTFRIRGVR